MTYFKELSDWLNKPPMRLYYNWAPIFLMIECVLNNPKQGVCENVALEQDYRAFELEIEFPSCA